MTELLFRTDAYLQSMDAVVTEITGDGAIILDRTVFYATSGGQPGDAGALELPNGNEIPIAVAIHPADRTRVAHLPEAGAPLPEIGDVVTGRIDWERRHRLMRMHTALHLLSVVLPYPVTGGSIGTDKGRLDFDMSETPEDRDALEDALNALVAADHPVSDEWITDEELAANPDLVKTMNVKPPVGQGRVRLVRIGSGSATVDLQPCGGTHVRQTGEIGRLALGKIEKKGRANRRVSIHFAE
ncbi:MAG TPA: alanyl-tRNA editing protein [Devosiaceae bacterium]